MPEQPCPHCGGHDITRGVHVGKTAEAGHDGLSYQTIVFVTGTEPMLADVCTGCGTVTRLWVQNPERKWWVAST